MTSKPTWHEELLTLCGAVRDEALSLGDRGRLEQLLKEHAEARTYYVQFFQLDACLQWHSLALANIPQDFDVPSTDVVPGETENAPKMPRPAGVVLGLLNAVSRRAPGGGLTVGLLVVFVIVAAFWGLSIQMLHPQKPSGTVKDDVAVAMVSSAADVHWSPETKPKTDDPAIHPGEPLRISSGFVQVELKSGATLLVEGPAQWSIDGNNRATLESGKIVAKVPSQAVGFTIQTPTATVIDLGTEFGVEVTEDQESRLHVFQGKIVVRANVSATSATGAPREIKLHAGEAAVLDAQGKQIRYSRAESQTALPTNSFIRNVPKKVIKILNLVDVVAGGDGFGKAHDRGIDPTTGKITAAQVTIERASLLGDGGYHRSEELPFVDGVFIPSGKNPVQLDSAGHTFAGFPSTDNTTWGQIWAGGAIPQRSVDGVNLDSIPAALDGVDYSATWHSLLSLHANKGITFDLQAIRRANPHGKIARFVTTAGNAAPNPNASDASKWCDVWVFVDGQLQFSRERIAAQREFKIAVELNDQSRFLALVATDGGDGFGWDHVIFVDPCLVVREILTGEPTENESGGRFKGQEVNSLDEKSSLRGAEKIAK